MSGGGADGIQQEPSCRGLHEHRLLAQALPLDVAVTENVLRADRARGRCVPWNVGFGELELGDQRPPEVGPWSDHADSDQRRAWKLTGRPLDAPASVYG